MANVTPPISSVGLFTVSAPFTITAVTYRVASISNIRTLVDSGKDVFTNIYDPKAISEAEYLLDLADSINIVTLVSSSGPEIVIPSSYILTYPAVSAVPYSNLVITVNLGNLPDNLTMVTLLSELEGISNNYTGLTTSAKLHKSPLVEPVTAVDSVIMEATRESSKVAVVSAWRAKEVADAELVKAMVKINQLEAIIDALTV